MEAYIVGLGHDNDDRDVEGEFMPCAWGATRLPFHGNMGQASELMEPSTLRGLPENVEGDGTWKSN